MSGLLLSVSSAFAGAPNAVYGVTAKALYNALSIPVTQAPEQGGFGTMDLKTGNGFSCNKSGMFPDSYECDFPAATFELDEFQNTYELRIYNSDSKSESVAKSVFDSTSGTTPITTEKNGMVWDDKTVGKVVVTRITFKAGDSVTVNYSLAIKL